MSRVVFKGGGAEVVATEMGAAMAEKLINSIGPDLIRKMEDAAREVMDNAIDRWPVGRWPVSHGRRPGTPGASAPHSRDTFFTETVINLESGFIKARIGNRLSHWWFIRPLGLQVAGGTTAKSAVHELIRKPMKVKRDEIFFSLADDVIRRLDELH